MTKRLVTPYWLISVLVCVLVGCGSKPPERTIADIMREREALPSLYLSEKTNQEVFAPLSKGRACVDPKTGEIAWLAYMCLNPDCPGKSKGQNGRPFLFTWRDPSPRIEPDGSVIYETQRGDNEGLPEYLVRMHGEPEATCPECLTKRDRAKETQKERLKYNDWVQVYVPPEQIAKAKALDAEIAAWKATLEERKNRKAKKEE